MSTLEDRARAFAALGDPARLAIVEMLRDEDVPPHAIGAALGMPSNLLAHHLRVLEDAGLIRRHRSQGDARRSYVTLHEEALARLIAPEAPIRAARVVFVCTENSARSVLAEAIWRTRSDVDVTSAGTHPGSRINPLAVSTAERAHLELGRDRPQSIDGLIHQRDLVVSVCDSVNEELPQLPNQRLHWSVPDPARVGTRAAFNAALRELARRVDALAPRVVASPARSAMR